MAASSGGMLVCTQGWRSTSAAVMRCPGSTVSIFCTSLEQLLDTCTSGRPSLSTQQVALG